MRALLIAATLLAAGTAHASDAKITTDDFDGATRVWVDPHGLECGWSMVCPSLGARWTSNRQNEAVLEVEIINAYTAIEGVKLNLDGAFLDLQPLEANAPTKLSNNGHISGGAPIVRYSSRDYLIPLELVQVMLAADSVKVRVATDDGFIDATLSEGKESSKALGALQRFWEKLPYHPAPTAPAAP